MTYEIRPTTFTELTDLINELIETEAFLQRRGDDSPFILSIPKYFRREPDLAWFAATDELDHPVAFVCTLPHYQPGTLAIGPLYVTPIARGKGLGRRLVERCIAFGRERDKTHVLVDTWGENVGARHTFESAGFRLVSAKPNARVNGDSTVCYRIDLDVMRAS